MTLTKFLLARIAEDEAVAREAGPDWISYQKADDYGMDDNTAVHVVTFSPHRVLAECEAKRQIVEMASWKGLKDSLDEVFQHGLGAAERFLVAVYADHEDYLPEWNLAEWKP